MEEKHTPEIEERNATLDDEPKRSADALQESILEDEGLNEFQKFCARMDERRWKRAQCVIGALLGLAAGVALFWEVIFPGPEGQQGMFSIPLLVAIAIALIVPNIIEKQGLRRAPVLRVAMVIALAAVLVIYVIVVALTGGFASA